MRLSAIFAILGTFLMAAFICLIAAYFSVAVIEETSRHAVRDELDSKGMTWTEIETDGLQVLLAGTAGSEAERFKAVTVAGTVVDSARVIDQMIIAEQEAVVAPRFSMEILRNDTGISLIGLVPASMNVSDFISRVEEAGNGAPVANFLETADYEAPQSWDGAANYALRSLLELQRAKISLGAEHISVTAMVESLADKANFEASLTRRVPEGIALTLDISAPRPVIAPFTLRFVIEDGQARFDACSADTEEAKAKIIRAARRAGLEGEPNCPIGLGVPSPHWATAAEMAIAALNELGAGVVTLADADISLVAVRGTTQAQFDAALGRLENELPEVFTLHGVLPENPEEDGQDVPEFVATLSPEGLVQLRGRVTSAAERNLIDSFAKARFSSDGVHLAIRVADGLPEGWTLRILNGLDALSYLSNGILHVWPDDMSISGSTGQEDTSAMISGRLSEKLGEGARFSIDIAYREILDPVASLPTPEECEARIIKTLEGRKITFEPSSANIDISGAEIMDDIAEILRECGEITMEIGGHTDSQGREAMNQRLSQSRAQAILNELRVRRVLTSSITAVGYGESQPIADNETEEGREANRRIEFKVTRPEDLIETETELETEGNPEEEQATEETQDTDDASATDADEQDPDTSAQDSEQAEVQEETSDEQN